MSLSNEKQENKVVTTNNIYYDYYDTPIYYNQFEKNVKTSGHIKVIYKNTENINHPNLTFYPELTTYETKVLYLFKKIHHLPNIPFDGEMVVEHRSRTNQSGSVFTCFLLKTRANTVFSYKNPSDFIDELAPALSQYPYVFGSNARTSTDIDRIIENAENPSLISNFDVVNLNKYIRSNKECIVYRESNNTVVIFLTPILVSNDFTPFTFSQNLFSAGIPLSAERRPAVYLKMDPLSNVNNYGSELLSRTEKKNAKMGKYEPKQIEGFQEGITPGDAYVDCTPINVDGVETAMMYEIPLGSDIVNDKIQSQEMQVTIYFMIFIIICIIFYSGVPYMVDLLSAFIAKRNDAAENKKFLGTFLITLNLFLAVFFLSCSIIFIVVGVQFANNKTLTKTGIWLMIITVLIALFFRINPDLMEKIKDCKSNIFDFFGNIMQIIKDGSGFAFVLLAAIFMCFFWPFYLKVTPDLLGFDIFIAFWISIFVSIIFLYIFYSSMNPLT